MAALNFPNNPGSQTPVNTFSPTSTPDATTNGATYIWNGTAWAGSTAGGAYLSLDVDAGQQTVRSTGLTIFAGKIETASTTSADPDKTVVTKDYLDGSSGGTGNFGYWNRTETVLSPSNAGDSLSIEGNVTSQSLATGTVTGSSDASFTGILTAGTFDIDSLPILPS